MKKLVQFDRRSFIKGASIGAAAGSLASVTNIASAAEKRPGGIINGKFNFDEIYDRDGTGNVKWDQQYGRFGEENVDFGMGVADMDFRGVPAIQDALEERIQHNNWGYENLTKSYKEAIVQWNEERHNYKLDPDTIVISSGVHTPLIATLNAVCQPQTKVLMNTPTYNGFYGDLLWSRTVAADSEMYKDEDGVYHIDWDDFEAKMTPDCHAFLLCNPQNPTGNMWSEDDLMKMGELCLKHGVTVLADEIHCDFAMEGKKYIPFASLPDKAIVNNSLTYKAVSKTFSLASMKSAYFFSTNPVLLERVKYMHRADLNSLGIIANEAAYRNGGEYFTQLNAYIDGNQSFAEAYIKEKMPAVKSTKGEGTYLHWLDIKEVAEAINADQHAKDKGMRSDSHYMEEWFVKNAKVQLNPGGNYGTGGNGHMRMNLGTSRPNIKKAIDNMAAAIKKI
jgi:cystathionine beta-lyase